MSWRYGLVVCTLHECAVAVVSWLEEDGVGLEKDGVETKVKAEFGF